MSERGLGIAEFAETTVIVFVLGACLLALSILVSGCGLRERVKEATAETVYLAQHLKCVDQFNTRQDIDTCRRKVRLNWGITETVAGEGSK